MIVILFFSVIAFTFIGIWSIFYYRKKRKDEAQAQAEAKKKEVHYDPEDVVRVEEDDSNKSITYGTNSLIKIEKDEFEGKTLIYFWICCSSSINKIWFYEDIEFGIGFKIIDDDFYITIGSYQKELKLNIGDELSVLFEDNSILKFNVSTKGVRFEKEPEGILLESSIKITTDVFDKFLSENVSKIRFFDKKKTLRPTYILNEKTSRDVKNIAKNIKHAYINFK